MGWGHPARGRAPGLPWRPRAQPPACPGSTRGGPALPLGAQGVPRPGGGMGWGLVGGGSGEEESWLPHGWTNGRCPFANQEAEMQPPLSKLPRPLSTGPARGHLPCRGCSFSVGQRAGPSGRGHRLGVGRRRELPSGEHGNVRRKGQLSLMCTAAPKATEAPKRQWPNPGLSGRASWRRRQHGPHPPPRPSPRGSKGLPGSRCGEERSASPSVITPAAAPRTRSSSAERCGGGSTPTVSQSAQVPTFL